MEHKKTQEKLRAWVDINNLLQALSPMEDHLNTITATMIHRARLALQVWGAELEEQTKHLEPQERADEKR